MNEVTRERDANLLRRLSDTQNSFVDAREHVERRIKHLENHRDHATTDVAKIMWDQAILELYAVLRFLQ